MKSSSKSSASRRPGFGLTLLLLAGLLSLLLYEGFLPGWAQFSNDGPLGRHMSQCHRLPGKFTGGWDDLNAIGFREEAATPSVTSLLLLLLGPVLFSKFYAVIALLILGSSAWCFFRELGLAPLACTLGGLAAALNSSFFSAACWGVASHPLTVAMFFLALAALADTTSRRRWLRVMLAGFAVGMGISEGSDIGAIYSLYAALFVAFQAFFANGALTLQPKRMIAGLGRVAVVGLCAALLAAQPVSELIATNITGVVGTQQDSQTKEARWDFATQWSLPKMETLGLLVPGLFGYRMDTPGGGGYWGLVGRSPEWDRYVANGQEGAVPSGLARYSGGGSYAGVLVVLLAIWAAAQGFRSQNSVFNSHQRRWIWFWLGIGAISLALAFGRFASFYRLIYALPYFSTIRNPVKFLSLVSVSVVVLFAYGMDGLWRTYTAAQQIKTRPKLNWWGQLSNFDRKWLSGCFIALGTSLLAWFLYSSNQDALKQYLSSVQIADSLSAEIASFSVCQVGWFVLFFAAAIILMTLIISRAFTNGGGRVAGVLFGLLLVADLGRANQPWIIFFNYGQMYAGNPIIDKLREKPFEHRVAFLPLNLPPAQAIFPQFYTLKWINHVFPYYDIQSSEVVQLPRMPEDLAAFQSALSPEHAADPGRLLARSWQLSNVRYLVGPALPPEVLNQHIDPAHPELRIVERFEIVPEPGVDRVRSPEQMTVMPATSGQYALWEFGGALPRAKLFSNWQEDTNDQAVLTQLSSASFDPARLVLVNGTIPAASPTANAGQGSSAVEFVSYAPKDIVLKTDAPNSSVLLLNDHYDPNWKVLVDGATGTLLRCNYIMRGVYLKAGSHTVQFHFEPPTWPLYVSLTGIGFGVLILCALFLRFKGNAQEVVLRPAGTRTAPAN